ncbi:DUF6427 family protein [Aureisphaera galaxeae]|uniref:DUF6427 family protein n=1 Tax=Aureisphaera galaxeae TaxID=1538023 RepID=UPI002350AA91|nr:DUF6427 family protein [Aureisphaera galaxeae]MDC8005061.1 DUF6427 family protein [Aureisphaera galaxeae]
MLTSFFRKSGPLNFLIVSLYLLLFATLWFFIEKGSDFQLLELGETAITALLLVFSLFLLDFIVRKNGLAQINAFTILLFASLVCFFPDVFSEIKMVGAQVCLLFAMRRIFSLQSLKNNERKILDASLWIAIATFLYPPSIIMLLGLQWAIFIMPITKLRFFFIPLVGLLAVILIAMAAHLLIEDNFAWLSDLFKTPSLDFSTYGRKTSLIGVAFITGSLIWALFNRMGVLSRIQKKERPNYMLVVVLLLVCLVIILGSEAKNTAEFLFAFAPMAIILANYVEHDSEKWFKEILLWVFLLLPFLRFFIS